LLGEKLNNKHPNSKLVLAKTPIVEDRSTSSTETKVRKKKEKTKHHNPTQLLLNP
jgi:hypothetical protein